MCLNFKTVMKIGNQVVMKEKCKHNVKYEIIDFKNTVNKKTEPIIRYLSRVPEKLLINYGIYKKKLSTKQNKPLSVTQPKIINYCNNIISETIIL